MIFKKVKKKCHLSLLIFVTDVPYMIPIEKITYFKIIKKIMRFNFEIVENINPNTLVPFWA